MDTVLADAIKNRIKKSQKEFIEDIASKMTRDRALRIKELRTVDGCTWGRLATKTYINWGNDALWTPASNGVAGSVLCSVAADFLDEDSSVEPWN